MSPVENWSLLDTSDITKVLNVEVLRCIEMQTSLRTTLK